MDLVTKILSARNELIKTVENQGLPPTVMKYLLKEILDMTIAASEREAYLVDAVNNTKVEVKDDNTNDQP